MRKSYVVALLFAALATFYGVSDEQGQYMMRMYAISPIIFIAKRWFGAKTMLDLAVYQHKGFEYTRRVMPKEKVDAAIAYKPTKDDVIVVTWPRSGTHMMCNALAQLLGKHEYSHMHQISYGLEFGGMASNRNFSEPPSDYPTRPRIIGTHMPAIHLEYSPEPKYVMVFRDPLDCFISMVKMLSMFSGYFAPSMDEFIESYFLRPNHYGMPEWLAGWYARINHPNVLVLFYEDFVKDREKELRRLASFLEIPVSEERLRKAVENTSFKWMKEHEHAFATPESPLAAPGTHSFLRKGVVGGGKDELTSEQIALIKKALRERFIKTGTSFPYAERYGI